MKDIEKLLSINAYPGRGIIFGMTSDMTFAVAAYFIMGRSSNSRNRVFIADGKGIRNAAYDESTLKDPSLVIYSPVRMCGNLLIVTNGDQTDTIYDYLRNDGDYTEALRIRSYEPDAPIYTPRVSGVMDLADGSYNLSIIKKTENPGSDSCVRQFFEYDKPNPGKGHIIHTYDRDGDPPVQFSGEPVAVGIPGSIDDMTTAIWENLNFDNKVSLFVRFTDLKTKENHTRIINKNK